MMMTTFHKLTSYRCLLMLMVIISVTFFSRNTVASAQLPIRCDSLVGDSPLSNQWSDGGGFYQTGQVLIPANTGGSDHSGMNWLNLANGLGYIFHQHSLWGSTNSPAQFCNAVVFQFPEKVWVKYLRFAAHDRNAEAGFILNSVDTSTGRSDVEFSAVDLATNPNCNDYVNGEQRNHLRPPLDACFDNPTIVQVNKTTNQLVFFANGLDDLNNEQVIFRLLEVAHNPLITCDFDSNNPTSVQRNVPFTFYWSSQNASSATVDGSTAAVSGNKQITLSAGRSISGTFYDSDGQIKNCTRAIAVYDPPSCTISASPATTDYSTSSVLTMNISNATAARLYANSVDQGLISNTPSTPFTGTKTSTVTPLANTAYQLDVYASAGSPASCTTTLNINPPTCSFSAADTTIDAGSATTLTWSSSSAGSLRINGALKTPNSIGSMSTGALAAGTHTYNLIASGNGTCTRTVTITSYAPATCSLSPSPTSIPESGNSTLTLTTQNATSATMVSPTTKPMPTPSGTTNEAPNVTTSYTVNVAGNGAGGSCSTTVIVRPTARCNLYSTDASIKLGESTELWWTNNGYATGDATLTSASPVPTPTPTTVPKATPSTAPLTITPTAPSPIPAIGTVRRYSLAVTGLGDGSSCTTDITVNPADCTLGDVPDNSIRVDGVAGPMHFAIATAPSTYDTARISWTQATENLPRTDHFDVNFYKGVETTSFLTLSTASPVTYLDLTPPQMRTIHDELVSVSAGGPTTDVRIEVTPRAITGSIWYCTNFNFDIESTASSGDASVSTDTQVTVRVREARNEACTTESMISPTEALMATASGTPHATDKVKGPQWVDDLILTFPTGKALESSYIYKSTLFECATACLSNNLPTTAMATIDPDFACKHSGYDNGTLIAKIFVKQRNIPSWWEGVGGLVYANDTLDSPLPIIPQSGGNPILCRNSITNANWCMPYLVRSAGFLLSDWRSGTAMAKSFGNTPTGWFTENGSNYHANNLSDIAPTISDALDVYNDSLYTYFSSLIPEDQWSEYADSTMFALPATTEDVTTIRKTGDLTLDPTSTINIPSDKSYTIFVDGNLTINNGDSLSQLTTVEPGGFLGFIVSGDITVSPYVGSTIVGASEPNVTDGIGQNGIPANLTGFFVTDGMIIVQSNENNSVPDLRFIGDGSFVARGSIELHRSYSRPLDVDVLPTNDLERNSRVVSGFSPTEVFRHRPDMVLSLPAVFKPAPFTYQEVQ